MTIEKAIEMINGLILNAKINDYFNLTTREFAEFEKVVNEVIQKTDALKPLLDDEYQCPCCEAVVMQEDNYCYDCGQRMDWSK